MSRQRKSRAPMPQIIARVQQFGATGKQWAANIDRQLLRILKVAFSPEEAKKFAQWRSKPISPQGMLEKLDTIILRQARTLGWRLVLASIVQRRFSDWDYDPRGPELFKRLGQAFAHSARIFQGLELPPIDDPGLYWQKRETVRELRELQAKIRERFPSDSFPKDRKERITLAECFLDVICSEKKRFVQLYGKGQNAVRWAGFLQQEENLMALGRFASRDRARRVTATVLFEQWLAWCKGAGRGKPFDQETLRKRISMLGKFFRS